MKVVNGIMQKGETWKAWRLGGITATDTADLLRGGMGWLDIWRAKTGRSASADLSRNTHIMRGVHNEPEARRVAENDLNDILLPVCVEHDTVTYLRASLDGITSDGIPTELKCPGEANWTDLWLRGRNSSVLESYRPQLHHQMLVTGAPYALIYFYNVDSHAFLKFRVDRDQALLDQILDAARILWGHVENDTPPPLGPGASYGVRDGSGGEAVYVPADSLLPSFSFKAEQYAQLADKKKALSDEAGKVQAEMDAIKESFEMLMGDHRIAQADGVCILKAARKGAVDWKKLADDLGVPDSQREKYRRDGTEVLSILTGEAADKRFAKLKVS